MPEPAESPDGTETRCPYRCLVSSHRRDYCNAIAVSGVLCTRRAGHDGPHAACAPHAHPSKRWPEQRKQFVADPPVIDAAMGVLASFEERGAA